MREVLPICPALLTRSLFEKPFRNHGILTTNSFPEQGIKLFSVSGNGSLAQQKVKNIFPAQRHGGHQYPAAFPSVNIRSPTQCLQSLLKVEQLIGRQGAFPSYLINPFSTT